MIKLSENKRWGSNHERLRSMWNTNPHCAWCGVKTTFYEEHMTTYPEKMATVDHLFSMSDPRRKWHKKNRTPSPIVLSCWKCNYDRQDMLWERYEEQTNTEINFEFVYYWTRRNQWLKKYLIFQNGKVLY